MQIINLHPFNLANAQPLCYLFCIHQPLTYLDPFRVIEKKVFVSINLITKFSIT